MPHKKNLTTSDLAVSVQFIERRIYLIRGQKVMIDVDLAELYGVPTKALNQQVQRNLKRSPEDFMFQLTQEEAEILRSQIAAVIRKLSTHDQYFKVVFDELRKLAEVTICDLKISETR